MINISWPLRILLWSVSFCECCGELLPCFGSAMVLSFPWFAIINLESLPRLLRWWPPPTSFRALFNTRYIGKYFSITVLCILRYYQWSAIKYLLHHLRAWPMMRHFSVKVFRNLLNILVLSNTIEGKHLNERSLASHVFLPWPYLTILLACRHISYSIPRKLLHICIRPNPSKPVQVAIDTKGPSAR